MAFILETPNPFPPYVGMQKHQHPGGISIRDWLQFTKGEDFVEFDQPTICIVNGVHVLRKDWDREIQYEDIINFIAVVGGGTEILIGVILLSAIALTLVIGPPTTPGEQPSSDPFFSAKGQFNDTRLGEPIEVNYGRNRIYPSLAARPFFQYQGDNQFQHSLFCIGQGTYEIEAVQIGDSALEDFQEAEYEIIEPGGAVTLFRADVTTSIEVAGQTLLAPDQTGFDYIGPFAVSAGGTTVDRIEIDIVFPRGLYLIVDGIKYFDNIHVEFEKRAIDNFGNPLGGWTTLFNRVVRAKTTSPFRRSIATVVPEGRYEVRGRRTSPSENTGYTIVGDVTWEAMRGFIVHEESAIDYGDVTLMAVRIRSTNNLTSRSQDKFNVIATRKLPIRYSGAGFTEPVATRSIVWAFVDVFRSLYGARITDEIFYDWDALETLDALYASREEYFDWSFRDPITVWEAAKTIARVGRAVPLITGSLITMKRDGPLSVPVTLFNPDNIVKGSLQIDVKLWEPDDFDSIRIEYTDPDTGYKQEQILCILPGETGDHPEDIRIPGIQSRTHAYHEGLYLAAVRKYLRENITLATGMEGFIPSYGDLVVISHDVMRWGQSGYILTVEDMSGSNVFLLHVSEPLRFESGIHQIYLRSKSNELIGPLTATETDDSKVVRVIVDDSDVDFLLGGESEPMLFVFGPIDEIAKYARLVKIEPQGGELVRITLVNENALIHSFDELEAPELTEVTLPPEVPEIPSISSLTLTQLHGEIPIISASWPAVFGAEYYVIQFSTSESEDSNDEEDVIWEEAGTTTRASLQLQVPVGIIHVRVAAVGSAGQGPWISGTIEVGLVAELVNHIPWIALDWGIRWRTRTDVRGWVVRVYDNSDPGSPVLKRTIQRAPAQGDYEYDYDMAIVDDNVVRDHLIEVDALVLSPLTNTITPLGFERSLELHNDVPTPPVHLEHEVLFDESGAIGYVYHLTWVTPAEADLITVKVWMTESFVFDTENPPTPNYEFTAGTPGYENLPEEAYLDVIPAGDGSVPQKIWRVALFDVWGNEISTNITDPLTDGGIVVEVLAIPTDLNITSNIPDTIIILEFTDNTFGGAEHEVWRKDGAGPYVLLVQLPQSITSHEDSFNIISGTTYFYKVRAYKPATGAISPFSVEEPVTN